MSGDVRLVGFAGRASVDQAQAWVDLQSRHREVAVEEVEVARAAGRVPVAPVVGRTPYPAADRAGKDGYAVRSSETVGASAYDPVRLRLSGADRPLAAGSTAVVEAGAALPPGADAVLPFDAALPAGQVLEVTAAVAVGAGVERAGPRGPDSASLVSGTRPIRPLEAALLSAAGLERLLVVGRPRVRVVVAGAKTSAAAVGRDAHLAMVHALIERDGGLVEVAGAGPDVREGFRRAAAAPGADLLLATGRTGLGPDDEAPLALAEAGRLDLHGIALRPGGSAGLGVVGALPVILLPGDPLACLCVYELLAGRLVRRLGGRGPELPHPRQEAEVTRKIVSLVGYLDVCQVRLDRGRAEPLGVPESGGLPAAARADGFVLVPASLEGYPAGAIVTVHRY